MFHDSCQTRTFVLTLDTHLYISALELKFHSLLLVILCHKYILGKGSLPYAT